MELKGEPIVKHIKFSEEDRDHISAVIELLDTLKTEMSVNDLVLKHEHWSQPGITTLDGVIDLQYMLCLLSNAYELVSRDPTEV